MASSLPRKPSNPFLNIKPSYKRAPRVAMRVGAQRLGDDEGKSSNIVDANLSVLRERIENVKIKERLERCCRCEYGWNYSPEYKFKLKKELGFLTQFIDLASLFLGTVGFTCLGGTLFLWAEIDYIKGQIKANESLLSRVKLHKFKTKD